MNKLIILFAALVLAACSSSGSSGGAPRTTPTTGPSTPASSPVSSATSTPSSSASDTPASHGTTPPSVLRNFRVADVTWVGSHGWALGNADCLSGSGRCDAIEQTTDGRTWTSLPAPLDAHTDADGSCPSGICVTGLRFATDKIGYAFGIAAFYTTADGGHSWHKESGSAVALETLDGTAIRVQYLRGLPGPVSAQVATIGSSRWSTVSLPGAEDFGASLGRAAGTSYLLTFGHPAGGGDTARSVLFLSRDGGRHWRGIGEPCPQNGGSAGEVDSTALTVAPDGAAVLTCRPRLGRGAQFVAVVRASGSIDVASRTALGSAAITGFGAASDKIILAVLGDTFRSTNGGGSFARLAANAGSSPGNPRYIGFASTTTGHAISADSRTIFTTTDAGRTWTAHRFG